MAEAVMGARGVGTRGKARSASKGSGPLPRSRFGLQRLWCIGALALAAVPLLAHPAPAQTTFGDIVVSVLPEPKGNASHGYTEYRVVLLNRSRDRSHTVTLSLPADAPRRPYEDFLRSVSRTVEVGPGLRVPVSLMHPNRPAPFGSGLLLRIDGRQEERVRLNIPSSGGSGGYGPYRRYGTRPLGYAVGSGGPTEPLVLVSARVGEGFKLPEPPGAGAPGMGGVPGPGGGGMAPEPPPGGEAPPPGAAPPEPGPPGAMPGMGGPPGGGAMMGAEPGARLPNCQLVRADSPVTEWSATWLSYSRYDGIVLTPEDLDDLRRAPPAGQAVRTALFQYAEAGGTLLVLGRGKVKLPASWGRVPAGQGGLTAYYAGFGRCLLSADRDVAKWDVNRWVELTGVWTETANVWRASPSIYELNNSLPVVDDVGVPVRGLFAVMILFGIAIGPVNLLFLAPRRKRLRLLWTVPAISLVTCVAVFGYTVFAEGWQGRARLEALTILDQTEQRATTLARAGFYSPLTPGDGLRFDTQTEVAEQGGPLADEGTGHTIEWGEDQHLHQGWVTARVPAFFRLRKSEPRRQRLAVTWSADGKHTVLNALGAPVRAVWVADAKGAIYSAGEVGAGEKSALSPTGKSVAERADPSWRRYYTAPDLTNTLKQIEKQPEEALRPGTYLAVLESTPFVEEGLRGAKLLGARSLVLGVTDAR
jgi:hypothetical protein